MVGWRVKNPEPKPRTRPHAKRIGSTGGQFVVNDELWDLVEPLLAAHPNTHRFGGGRPRVSDRVCADGIFFLLRTGCQWNALSATGSCPSSTAHDRFQAWVEDGFFLRFWPASLGRVRGLQRQRLELAGDGWSDDQSAPGRGKKPAPVPWTAANRAPNARG